MRRLLIAAGSVLLLAAALVSAGPPASAATPSGINVVFQQDASSGGDNEIIAHKLEALLAGMNGKWSMYISMYDLTDNGARTNDVVDKLIDAINDSGIVLHAVIDAKHAPRGATRPAIHKHCANLRKGNDPKGGWTRAATRIWCIATRHGAHPSRFRACVHSCLGPAGATNGIDHNKLELFAGPAGQRIVAAGSANWTPTQLANKFQTMVITRNHNSVYGAWKQYWNALHANRPRPTYGDSHNYNGKDIDLHFFPSSSDPRLTALRKASCSKHTLVRMDLNVFQEPAFSDQLRSMQNHGCHVQVILKKGASARLLRGIPHRCIPTMHSKDLVIDGHYAKSGARLLTVWTGSRPLGGGPRGSDNADMRLHGSGFVSAFEKNFAPIWAKSGSC